MGCGTFRKCGFIVSLLLFWVLASCSDKDCTYRDEPTHTLDGRKLAIPYVGRNLMWPRSPHPTILPYSSTEPFIDPFEEKPSGATMGDFSGATSGDLSGAMMGDLSGATAGNLSGAYGRAPPELDMFYTGNGGSSLMNGRAWCIFVR